MLQLLGVDSGLLSCLPAASPCMSTVQEAVKGLFLVYKHPVTCVKICCLLPLCVGLGDLKTIVKLWAARYGIWPCACGRERERDCGSVPCWWWRCVWGDLISSFDGVASRSFSAC